MPAATSRPRTSVPKSCRPNGGANGRSTRRNGLPGKRTGAAVATASTTARMATPSTPPRLRTNRRQKRFMPGPSRVDARVEQRVEDVDHQVHDDHQARREEEDAEQQVEVAGEEGLEGEQPQAGPGEDRLHDDGAAEQTAHLDAGQRDRSEEHTS